MRYPNGLSLVKAGEKKRAITWRVVEFDNETSPNFSFNGEVGEVKTTPAYTREEKSDDDNIHINKDRVETTSPNLTLASKGGEVAPDDLPDYPAFPCFVCGCTDFWLRKASRWGKAEWLCSRCHPNPEGGGKQ